MTITLTDLPREVEQFIRAKATEEGYVSSEDYIRALLLREAALSQAADRRLGEDESAKPDLEMGLRIANFLEGLHQDGIIEKPNPLPTERQIDERELVEIQGMPLSETVIEDRR